MRPNIDQISTKDGAAITSDMGVWIRRSGVPSKKLAGLAKTCLGVAYKQDNTEAALASLLVLSGLKDAIYIEQMGYHVALGLTDAPESFTQAQSWLETAASAQTDGPVSLTDQSSDMRISVLADVLGILSAPE